MSEDIGKTFGVLTVLSSSLRSPRPGGKKRRYYLVRCECGTEKEVLAQNIRNGRTKSCGCRSTEWKRQVKHGLHSHRVYQTYHDMRQRCLNPANPRYHRYGGRGITICDEWQSDPQAFFDWAFDNGYDDSLTIERINNDGNYCPENCKWATMAEQLQNRTFRKGNAV